MIVLYTKEYFTYTLLQDSYITLYKLIKVNIFDVIYTIEVIQEYSRESKLKIS